MLLVGQVQSVWHSLLAVLSPAKHIWHDWASTPFGVDTSMNSPATLAASRVVIRVWAVKLATGRFARCDSSLLNHREEKHH